jgi:hypothetical protein
MLLFSPADRLLVGALNDDGVYVALGKAIASGEGYRSIHLVGDPVQVKYPPGLPALLTLLWWIGGTLPIVAALIQTLNVIATAAAAGLLWYYGRRVLRVEPLPLAIFALGPLLLEATLQYHSLALAEPYFLLGWVAALIVIDRICTEDDTSGRTALAVGLGLILALTTLFRTQALVIIPAILLALAVKRVGRRAWLACAAAASLPLVAWRAVHAGWVARGPVSLQPDETPYTDWVTLGSAREFLAYVHETVAANVGGYLESFAPYLSGIPAVGYAVISIVFLLALIASFRRRANPALSLSIGALLAVVLLWPLYQDRLLLPALPFVGLLAALSLGDLVRTGGPALRRSAMLLLIPAAGAVGIRQVQLRIDGARALDAGRQPEYFSPTFILAGVSGYIEKISDWVLQHTSPEDRILVEYPAGVYLRTGRKTVRSAPAEPRGAPSVFVTPGEFLIRRITEDSVTVIILGNPAFPIARDAGVIAERCPDALRLIQPERVGSWPVYLRVYHEDDCIGANFPELHPTSPAPHPTLAPAPHLPYNR